MRVLMIQLALIVSKVEFLFELVQLFKVKLFERRDFRFFSVVTDLLKPCLQTQVGNLVAILFVVVLFPSDDGKGTVELLHKHHAHHLVGERHLGQRQLLVRPLVDLWREPVRSTNDEHQSLAHRLLFPSDPFRQFHTPQFLTVLVEQHHMVAVLQLFQQEFTLHPFLHLLRQSLGVLQFGYGHNVEWTVVSDPCRIVADDSLKLTVHCLAHL